MENWFFQIEILIGLANFLLVAKKVKLTSGNVGLLWKYFQSYLTTALGGDKLYKAGFLCLLILFSICSHVQWDTRSPMWAYLVWALNPTKGFLCIAFLLSAVPISGSWTSVF